MIILTGASASGKTVTALGLQRKYSLKKAITSTTREKRVGEEHGKDYFFYTKEEFLKRRDENKFVETSLYNNNYYGCGVDQVSDDKVIVLDPNGLHSFQKLNNKNIVSFLLTCDEKEREKRMILRGDETNKIKERLTNDRIDFAKDKIGKVDCVIDTQNKSIDDVIDTIYCLYQDIIAKNNKEE